MNILTPNMDEIAEVIIRPSRYLYKMSDLGAKLFVMEGISYARKDFQVQNTRNLIIKCSYYSKEKEAKSDNVLIYLHCNSGCRVQGLAYLRLAVQNDFSYLVFDFSGSGLSQGKYVSLGMQCQMQQVGFHQAEDLEAVIKYVKKNINQDAKFCLWGRSMGAVTALRFLALNRELIRVAIFDSPFQSLKKLFIQIGKERTNLPQILLNVAYKYIKPIILSKADFDIDEVDLEPLVSFVSSPGIFIASKRDLLIPFQQIEDIFNKYKGEKQMFFIEETHNQARNMGVIRKVFKTLKKYLLLSQQIELKKQKTSYYSILPQKDSSKKKLQLTIKSLSQRQLKSREPLELCKPHDFHVDFGVLEKRQTSCLFPVVYRKEKKSDMVANSQSQIFLQTKRKPLTRHFASENTLMQTEEKMRPKFSGGEPKIIEIKMKLNQLKEKSGRSRQRKTLQHISSKKPPFVELKGIKQLRNSFQLRYRS